MRRTRVRVFAALMCALAMVVCVAGCASIPFVGQLAPSEPTAPTLEPKVANDALVKEDILTIGLDYSYAPFAGEIDGRVVGIDADVGAALGEALGLNVEFVDVGTGGGPNAVANKQCDVFLSFQKDDATNSVASYAGTYLYDAAALFVVSDEGEPEVIDAKKAAGSKIAAQKGRATAELVSSLFGSTSLVEEDSLASAFKDLEDGAVKYAAASSVVGKYIASSYDDIYYVAALEAPHEIGAGVSSVNKELKGAVAQALKDMSTNGVTNVIVRKWIGTPVNFGSTTTTTTTTGSTTTNDKDKANKADDSKKSEESESSSDSD